MKLFRKLLIPMSGNRVAQNLLRKNINISRFLMGFGAGGKVDSSGERAVFNLLRKNHDAPFCIFDVGANKGQYLGLTLRELEHLPCVVHCFEPGKHSFELLKNKFGDTDIVRLNNYALGEYTGEATLYADQPGSGLASLSRRNLDHFDISFKHSETVTIDTLDEYCSRNNIEHIHLLKIDVEGYELEVLHGSSGMLKKGAIDIIAFEFGGCNIDTRTFIQDFHYFFQDVGMSVSRVTPSGYLFPMPAYEEEFEQFKTTNYVAVRPLQTLECSQ